MNKLESEKINFDEDDYVVQLKRRDNFIDEQAIEDESAIERELELEFEQKKQEAFLAVQKRADEILNNASDEAKLMLERARNEAQEILDNAKQEAQTLKEASINEVEENKKKSLEETEQLRIEEAKRGYEEGHKDGIEKAQEELEEKISLFDKFIKTQFEAKEKIIESSSTEILSLINAISRKVILKEITPQTLDRVIKESIKKLEKKEDIKIIVSEEYARLLYEIQKKSLENEIDFNFENFTKYENFEIIYNSKFPSDTLIVENLKERLDASFQSQLDIIIRNIYEKTENDPLVFEENNKDKIEDNREDET